MGFGRPTGTWRKRAIAASASLLVALISLWVLGTIAERFNETLFPATAGIGVNRSLTPVPLSLDTREGTVHWRIPKAYLPVRANWNGGRQNILDLDAAVVRDSDTMAPWSIFSEQRRTGSDRFDRVQIFLQPSGDHYARHHWFENVLPRLEPAEGAQPDDLQRYRYKVIQRPDGPYRSSVVVFAPAQQDPERTIYFECETNGAGALLGCSGNTDAYPNIVMQYIISSRNLDWWQEIDLKVRTLLDSFRAPGP